MTNFKKIINGSTIIFVIAVSLVLYLSPAHRAMAAGASANALCSVIAALGISAVSDMDFGEGIQGDSQKIVSAGSSENAENASFDISGEPNRTFSISLPGDGTIEMITGAGATAEEKIGVDSFASNPSVSGTLDGSGDAMLYVGATRSALLSNQVAGSYSGSFQVTVVY